MSSSSTKTRLLKGKVVSDKMDKTLVVKVVRYVKHALYKKYIRKTKKFHVHDSSELAKMGDVVAFKSCRPISKTKCWELVEVVQD